MFCIPDIDYFKDFNMMLNDNTIDCFLEDSLNITESITNDINIKYTEIKVPIEKSQKELSNNLEKLNKNKIHNNISSYNGYRTIKYVRPTEKNRNCEDERSNNSKAINDDTRPGRIKRNNLLKCK